MSKIINKHKWICISVLTAFIVLLIALKIHIVNSNNTIKQTNQANYQQKRLLRFSYEVANTSSKVIQKAIFSSYLPVTLSSSQSKGDTQSLLEFTEIQGEIGNRVAQFDMGLIPPYGKKIIKFVTEVNTAEQPNSSKLEDPNRYLVEEPFVETHHPVIQKLAKSLRAEKPKLSVENIYNWVSTQIQYAGYVSQDKGALYALEAKTGDCTEYMYVVVALARALDIPARGIGGYVYTSDSVASATDYHNWAEVYIDGRWQIIDAQKKVFMAEGQNYIAMRILSDQSVNLLGSSHRFSTVNKNLIVKMN